MWAGSTILFLWHWPPVLAVQHLVVLGIVGVTAGELCLSGAQKIPFTCSYLPGKSQLHLTFWLCIALIQMIVLAGAKLERDAMENPASYAAMVALLGVLAIWSRWRTSSAARSEIAALSFEEEPVPAVQVLNLSRPA